MNSLQTFCTGCNIFGTDKLSPVVFSGIFIAFVTVVDDLK